VDRWDALTQQLARIDDDCLSVAVLGLAWVA